MMHINVNLGWSFVSLKKSLRFLHTDSIHYRSLTNITIFVIMNVIQWTKTDINAMIVSINYYLENICH